MWILFAGTVHAGTVEYEALEGCPAELDVGIALRDRLGEGLGEHDITLRVESGEPLAGAVMVDGDEARLSGGTCQVLVDRLVDTAGSLAGADAPPPPATVRPDATPPPPPRATEDLDLLVRRDPLADSDADWVVHFEGGGEPFTTPRFLGLTQAPELERYKADRTGRVLVGSAFLGTSGALVLGGAYVAAIGVLLNVGRPSDPGSDAVTAGLIASGIGAVLVLPSIPIFRANGRKNRDPSQVVGAARADTLIEHYNAELLQAE